MKKIKLILFSAVTFIFLLITNLNVFAIGFDPEFEQYKYREDLISYGSIYKEGGWNVEVEIEVPVPDNDVNYVYFEFWLNENHFSQEIYDYHVNTDSRLLPDWYSFLTMYWNPEEQYWQLDPYVSSDYHPVYEGQTAFVTNINNPITIDELLSKVKLIDAEDGDVSHTIEGNPENFIVNDGFGYWDENNNGIYDQGDKKAYAYFMGEEWNYQCEVGTYYLKIRGHDYSDNWSYLTAHILIKDIDPPVILGQQTYNQSYTTKLNVGTVLNGLSVTDNYDITGLNIIVANDNYTANYSSLGSYIIKFTCVDTSNNIGSYDVTINVIDDVAPTFTGPETIMKNQTEILTVNDIKNQLTANDYIDGQVNITVKEDNYSGKGDKVGTYTIIFKAVDNSGNEATHTVTVTVADDIPPIWYVDNYFITVAQSIILTREDIIAILEASGQLEVNSTMMLTFVLNEYENNENIPGVYAMTIRTSSADGSAELYNLAVEVVEDEDGIILKPEEKIKEFFTNIWNWLKTPTKEEGKFYKGYFVLIGIGVLFAIIYNAVSKNNRGRRRKRW